MLRRLLPAHDLHAILPKRMEWHDANIAIFVQMWIHCGKTVWTRLGRGPRRHHASRPSTWAAWTTRCRIRHALTMMTIGIAWATMYKHALGRSVAINCPHGPGRPAPVTGLITCHYMVNHYMVLHAGNYMHVIKSNYMHYMLITCHYMHVIACNDYVIACNCM